MSLIIPANTLASGGYEVANSVRLNDGSSDYFNRTPGSATNQKTFTISMWVKRGELGSSNGLLLQGVNTGNDDFAIYFTSADKLQTFSWSGGSKQFQVDTQRVFRDVSAWYHIVFVADTTQGTDSNRIKIYINGVQETALENVTYPSVNADLEYNDTSALWVGRSYGGNYFDGYMAEVVSADGTALTPTDFGEFDEDSGIWKPIDVSGLTFGTNGFYLDFEDSSALGADVSGNSNNFTVNNLTAIDQSTDTCTTNFCTLNSISEHNNSTFSDGNLTYTGSAAAVHNAIGSIGVTQGKWYFEAKRVAGASAYPFVGVFNADGTMGSYLGQTVDGWSILMDAADNGEWRNNATLSGTSVGAFVNGDIGMVAIDMDNGKIWFGRNGTWGDSGNPSAGSGEQYSNLTGTIIPAVAVYTGAAISLNFGSPPYSESGGETDGNGYGNFAHAVPSGYYSLNTKNLAEYG